MLQAINFVHLHYYYVLYILCNFAHLHIMYCTYYVNVQNYIVNYCICSTQMYTYICVEQMQQLALYHNH